MCASNPGEETWSTDDVLGCLTNHRRRTVLSVLRKRTTPISTANLASQVAAELTGHPIADVSSDERDRIHVSLRNCHLPRLAEANLIEWDSEADDVVIASHVSLGDERVQRMVEESDSDLDRLLRAVESTRRRIALSVIESADSIDRRALATRVAARETERPAAQVDDEAVEAVLVELHHVHVPMLLEAGLVVSEDDDLRYSGHPDLDPELFELAAEESVQNGADTPEMRQVPPRQLPGDRRDPSDGQAERSPKQHPR